MINYTASFADIETDFKSRRIPLDMPGFYDHPNFLETERLYPTYLNHYARYVHDRLTNTAYDAHVRKTVPIVAQIFHEHLKSHGRLGACVDISGLLSRALEREGIWNFIVSGSLTIDFPSIANISPRYFWSIDTGEFTAAHAWVAAPPFYVIDISIKLQPYSDGEELYLPTIVCVEAETLSEGVLEDIISPEVRVYLSQRGIPKNQQLQHVGPEIATFMKVFPARLVKIGKTTMKYIPVAITAPDCPFEEMTSIIFEGRTGFEIYTNEIKPALAEAAS